MVDMKTGDILAQASEPNGQRTYGADILLRFMPEVRRASSRLFQKYTKTYPILMQKNHRSPVEGVRCVCFRIAEIIRKR